MKVEGPKSTSSVQQVRKTKKAGESASPGAFASELEKATADSGSEAAPVEQPGTVAGVGGILAAQTVGQEGAAPNYEERQRRAKRGQEMLDRLEEIRRGLLLGAIPKDQLGELARLVREKRERGADTVISRLLDEIELRAEVELAKLARRLA
jgi:hypothetical protein